VVTTALELVRPGDHTEAFRCAPVHPRARQMMHDCMCFFLKTHIYLMHLGTAHGRVGYELQITDYSLLQVLTVLPFKQHVLETAKRPFPLVRLGLRV
jgi:hypothetical protein